METVPAGRRFGERRPSGVGATRADGARRSGGSHRGGRRSRRRAGRRCSLGWGRSSPWTAPRAHPGGGAGGGFLDLPGTVLAGRRALHLARTGICGRGATPRACSTAVGRSMWPMGQAAAAGNVSAWLAWHQDGIASSLRVPLRAGGRIVGVLYANSRRPDAFSVAALGPLQALADYAARGRGAGPAAHPSAGAAAAPGGGGARLRRRQCGRDLDGMLGRVLAEAAALVGATRGRWRWWTPTAGSCAATSGWACRPACWRRRCAGSTPPPTPRRTSTPSSCAPANRPWSRMTTRRSTGRRLSASGSPIAVVTGAASGIGRASALAFAARGAKVVVSDVQVDGGEATVAEIKNRVATPCSFARMFRCGPKWKRCSPKRSSIMDESTARTIMPASKAPARERRRWRKRIRDRTIAINLKGVWLCMKCEIRQMLRNGGGAIVNTASIAGQVGLSRFSAYSASKHGIVGLTKSAALEYARFGLRINAVCPGLIDTGMIDRGLVGRKKRNWFARQLIQPLHERVGRALLTRIQPSRRMGSAKEVADVVVWLCSDSASFVDGHALTVDGGFTAQ